MGSWNALKNVTSRCVMYEVEATECLQKGQSLGRTRGAVVVEHDIRTDLLLQYRVRQVSAAIWDSDASIDEMDYVSITGMLKRSYKTPKSELRIWPVGEWRSSGLTWKYST